MFRTISSCLAFAAVLCGAERADLIVSARYVVTVDPAYRVIENGEVAVSGSKILAVGPKAQIERDYRAARRLDRSDAVLMPGLVNTHTHAAMSLLRGIADDRNLQDWLEHYIFPAEAKNVSPEFVEWGTKLACIEMLLSGTTTLTDMYYFEDVAARAVKQAGMRGVMGQTIIRFPVNDAKTPAEALARTERLLAEFDKDPLITAAPAPHAIYTNSDETLKAARALADRYHAPVVIHVSETENELRDSLAERHATPVEALEKLGVLDGPVIAAHCVWLQKEDMGILARKHVGVAHCPSSNMKLSSGAAPIADLIAAGVRVGLGTDGPAGSNNDLDLMEEMDLAGKLQKLITRDPTALPARKLVEMATIDGARVLGLEAKIGSLEPGKCADMIAISLREANAIPLYDVSSQIVYALKGADVLDVWVNGKQVVSDKHVLTLDAARVFAKADELAARVRESVK